jgi:hypothetical protein
VADEGGERVLDQVGVVPVRTTFDPKEQLAVLQKVHEKFVDDALFLMVTHDGSNPPPRRGRVMIESAAATIVGATSPS